MGLFQLLVLASTVVFAAGEQDCHSLIQYPLSPPENGFFLPKYYRDFKPGTPLCSSNEIWVRNFDDCNGPRQQFEPWTEIFSYFSAEDSNVCHIMAFQATTILYNSRMRPYIILIKNSSINPQGFMFLRRIVFNSKKSKEDFCRLKKNGELKLFHVENSYAPKLTDKLEKHVIASVNCESPELETLEKLKKMLPDRTEHIQTQCCHGWNKYVNGGGSDKETRNRLEHVDFNDCLTDAPFCSANFLEVLDYDDCSGQTTHEQNPVAKSFSSAVFENSNVCQLQIVNEVETLYFNPWYDGANGPSTSSVMITIRNSKFSDPKAFAKLAKIDFHTQRAKDTFCKLKAQHGNGFRIFDVDQSGVSLLKDAAFEQKLIHTAGCP